MRGGSSEASTSVPLAGGALLALRLSILAVVLALGATMIGCPPPPPSSPPSSPPSPRLCVDAHACIFQAQDLYKAATEDCEGNVMCGVRAGEDYTERLGVCRKGLEPSAGTCCPPGQGVAPNGDCWLEQCRPCEMHNDRGQCVTMCPLGAVCSADNTCKCAGLCTVMERNVCVSTCEFGRTCNSVGVCVDCLGAECGGVCIDIQRDNKNCGKCGKVCPPGQECTNGSCVLICLPSQTSCGINECCDPDQNCFLTGGADVSESAAICCGPNATGWYAGPEKISCCPNGQHGSILADGGFECVP
jgi:hypothetical protein